MDIVKKGSGFQRIENHFPFSLPCVRLTPMEDKMREAFKAYIDSDGEVEFDLHAQDTSEWAWLAELIPGIIISSAGGHTPFEAQGLLHGLPFYYRHEWGYASLQVGQVEGSVFSNYLYYATTDYDEKFGDPDFTTMLMELVPKLEVAPFLWKFPCKKVKFTETEEGQEGYTSDEDDYRVGWGFTPEEGYARTQEPIPYLVEKGFTVERQRHMWELHQVQQAPMNEDNRVFPNPVPNFHVTIRN